MVEPLPRGRNPFDDSGVERGADGIARYVDLPLADFKVPQYVALREELLPRNPGGKVPKAQLREQKSWGEALR